MMDILQELQSLDEPMKKKILIVATAIIMVVVVYFWLGYFNSLVSGVTAGPAVGAASQTVQSGATAPSSPSVPVAPAVTATPAAGSADSAGLWQNIANGFASFARDITGIFQAPRQYIVQPQ